MALGFTCFNELSFDPKRHTAAEARIWLLQFVQMFNGIWRLGLRRLRVRADFRTMETIDGIMLDSVIISLPHSERGILLSAFDSPHIRSTEIDAENRFLRHSISQVDNNPVSSAEGLLCAWIHGTLALSLPSHPRWNSSYIPIETQDESNNFSQASIAHASDPVHVNAHLSLIGKRIFSLKKIQPSEVDPLPNSEFSRNLIPNSDWSAFYVELLALPSAEKIPNIQSIATSVAYVNGYDVSEFLTRINQHLSGSYRLIFSYNDTLYLSTDFEKGAYEVCDKNGRQIGEWLFSGEKHQDRDKSGKHNIVLQ